jgi:transposase
VSLVNEHGKWRSRLHQLILTVFVGPQPPGLEACHRNDCRFDNRLDNLYWGTRKQNAEDALRNGKVPTGEQRPGAKLNWEAVRTMRREYANGDSVYVLAERYGVSFATIGQVIRGDNWKEKGYAKPDIRNSATGERHGMAKLTRPLVNEIREKYATGSYTKAALAREYGVGETTITRVVSCTHWK